jgi:hypothetical protein
VRIDRAQLINPLLAYPALFATDPRKSPRSLRRFESRHSSTLMGSDRTRGPPCYQCGDACLCASTSSSMSCASDRPRLVFVQLLPSGPVGRLRFTEPVWARRSGIIVARRRVSTRRPGQPGAPLPSQRSREAGSSRHPSRDAAGTRNPRTFVYPRGVHEHGSRQ